MIRTYLSLIRKKEAIGEDIEKVRDKIVIAAKKLKASEFQYGASQVVVSRKEETIFPGIGEKGREEIEKIMAKSKELKNILSFDIVKLGNAFDGKKLSPSLAKKLEPFARKQETVRVYVKKVI